MPFYGREEELAILRRHWDAVVLARRPQIVTLMAETGIGKSRCIQEFYQRLTRDPIWNPPELSYWPQDFQEDEGQLRVTPDLTDHTPQGQPRFLWLGLRWSEDPQVIRRSSIELTSLHEQFRLHGSLIESMRPVWERSLRALAQTGRDNLNAATFLEQMIDTLIPFGGMVFDLTRTAGSLLFEPRMRSLDDIEQGRVQSITTTLLTLFRQLCGGRRPLPVIVWLDDAQWMDPTAEAFFHDLLKRATTYGWPLMLLATSWPREWHELPVDHLIRSGEVLPLAAAPTSDLAALISQRLPGLSPEQNALLVQKANGNFLTLVENIGQLLTSPRSFLNGDIQGPLTAQGITMIMRWEEKRQLRIAQRFNELEESVRDFLGRASQVGLGSRFMVNVLRTYAAMRNLHGTDELIERCIAPLSITNPAGTQLHEFRDRGYQIVAMRHFQELLAAEEHRDLVAVLDRTLDRWVKRAYEEPSAATSGMQANQDDPLLGRLSYAEEVAILSLAEQRLQQDEQALIQTRVLLINTHAVALQWREVMQIVPSLYSVDWSRYAGIISQTRLRILADNLADLGEQRLSTTIYATFLSQQQTSDVTNDDPRKLRTLVTALANYGVALAQKGHYPDAIKQIDRALQLSQTLPDSSEDAFRPQRREERMAGLLVNLGWLHDRIGAQSESQRYYREACEHFRSVVQHDLLQNLAAPIRTKTLAELANALKGLGVAELAVGMPQVAQPRLAEALQLYRQVREESHDPYSIDAGIASTLTYLQTCYQQLGNHELILSCEAECFDLTQQLVQERGLPTDLRAHAVSLNQRTVRLLAEDDPASAVKSIEQSLAIARQLATEQPSIDHTRELALSLINTAVIYEAVHRPNDARTSALEALRQLRSVIAQRDRVRDRADLADMLMILMRVDEANTQRYLQEALDLSRQLVSVRRSGEDHARLSLLLEIRADELFDAGDQLASRSYLEEATNTALSTIELRGTDSDFVRAAELYSQLVQLHVHNRDAQSLLQSISSHTSLTRRRYAAFPSPDAALMLSETLLTSALIAQRGGNQYEALAQLREAFQVQEEQISMVETWESLASRARVARALGNILVQSGDPDEGYTLLKRNLEFCRRLAHERGTERDHRALQQALNDLPLGTGSDSTVSNAASELHTLRRQEEMNPHPTTPSLLAQLGQQLARWLRGRD